MADFEMRRWALKGAEQRLREIAEEAARIYAVFPELRARLGLTSAGVEKRGPGRPQNAASAGGNATVSPRRRPKMSREAKERIADAQRKRWAAWRAKRK